MGRNLWIGLGVVVLLILTYIVYLFWPSGSDSATATSTKTGKTETTEMQLKTKDCEIDKLNALIEARDSSIAKNERMIALLIENCNGKKSTGSYAKPSPAKSGTPKISSGNSGGGSLTITKTTEPEADYDVNINSVPKSKVNLEINEMKFCVRLGEQFWPHLAINQGKEFPEVVDNGIGGFDLFILPSGSVGSTGKPYGIAEDGTYWIAVTELNDWSQFSPYILGAKGFFVKAERSGSYWIAK